MQKSEKLTLVRLPGLCYKGSTHQVVAINTEVGTICNNIPLQSIRRFIIADLKT